MNLRQLQALQAVIVTGSATQAAERLGISQPAVSSLIANLERDVGFPLFERRKGRLNPTPEARYFFDEVEKTLSGMDKIAHVARDIRDLKSGHLRIACMPGLSLVFLPQVVARFLKDRPEVTVSLQTRSSQKVQEWIAANLFDVGISELPIDIPGIEVEPFSFDCVCALPEGHPLCHHAVLSPRELDGVPFIALSPDHMTHYRTRNAFAEAGATWRVAYECQLFAPACTLVAEGAGVAIIDPVTAANYAGRGIVTRPFEPPVLFDLAILYPAKRPHSRLADNLVAAIKEGAMGYGAFVRAPS